MDGRSGQGRDRETGVSKGTNALDGIALSSVYIIDNNLAPVMNMSYGNCEANLGTGNAYYAILWQQAAAEGISVMVSSGDSGSAGCDDPNSKTPASRGLAVSGFASTPYNIAVGGTSLCGSSNASASPGYLPESAWNESSYVTGSSSNSLLGGGGGVSHIYATPAWQTGKGVPSGDPGNPSQHHLYVPDVSADGGRQRSLSDSPGGRFLLRKRHVSRVSGVRGTGDDPGAAHRGPERQSEHAVVHDGDAYSGGISRYHPGHERRTLPGGNATMQCGSGVSRGRHSDDRGDGRLCGGTGIRSGDRTGLGGRFYNGVQLGRGSISSETSGPGHQYGEPESDDGFPVRTDVDD
jgi:hypothetical protein